MREKRGHPASLFVGAAAADDIIQEEVMQAVALISVFFTGEMRKVRAP
jgi:hypothetical protein